MRKLLVALWLILLVVAVGALFWYNQYRYTIPTPVPAGYKTVTNGTYIRLLPGVNRRGGKPVFLHFFNPGCPCSRFNINHVKSLIKAYGGHANFAVVLVSSKRYTARQIQNDFGLNVPVIQDASLAAACGVYSTPQAVILTPQQQLYYRGNYNTTRYCTNKKTEFARQALNNLLHGLPVPTNLLANKAYGCSLAPLNTDTYVAQ